MSAVRRRSRPALESQARTGPQSTWVGLESIAITRIVLQILRDGDRLRPRPRWPIDARAADRDDSRDMRLNAVRIAFPAAALVALPLLAQQPTFRAGVDVVKVDVSIARGVEHVSGLTAENFEVFDNGVKQKITNVATAQVPLEVYLVLDLSGSVQGESLAQLKRAANALVDGLVPCRPGRPADVLEDRHGAAGTDEQLPGVQGRARGGDAEREHRALRRGPQGDLDARAEGQPRHCRRLHR